MVHERLGPNKELSEKMGGKMKLYDVSNNTTVIIKDEKVIISPWSLEIKKGDVLQFDHIDGMYSYCRIKTKILFIRLLGRK